MIRASVWPAAFVVSTTYALGADLPIAETMDDLRICAFAGAGKTDYYHLIPGTDTCLAIHGTVVAEMHYVNSRNPDFFYDSTESASTFNNATTYASGEVRAEARTPTDFGEVKALVKLQFKYGFDDPDSHFGLSPEFDTYLEEGYVEVHHHNAVFTAGRTYSFFEFFGSDTYGTRIDIDDAEEWINLIGYTLNGQNGWSAALSVEDPLSACRRQDSPDSGYAGQEFPDLVGHIRREKGNVTGQVMAVVRHVHGEDGDGFGWAAGAGLGAKNIASVFGLNAQVAYGEGTIGYVTEYLRFAGDFNGTDGADTNRAFGIRSGATAQLNSATEAWLDGSFTWVGDHAGNGEYNYWAVVGGAAWTLPKSAVKIGPEFAYARMTGFSPSESATTWGAMFRIQSDF